MTHNHLEGIKGAEATASALFMARTGSIKNEIKNYIISEFGYDLSRTCDEIRPTYYHVETCQQTIPEAITAFLEGENFEDVIRTAVSLGGDCDTLTCIAGSMAEAFYGVPDDMKAECRKHLPEDMLAVIDRFEKKLSETQQPFYDSFLDGNELIETAIETYHKDSTKENLIAVLDAIRQRMHEDGLFIFPVLVDENDENSFAFRTLTTKDGKVWHAAFTSHEEYEKGAPSQVISNFIDAMLKSSLDFEADGDVEYTVPDDPVTSELLVDGTFLKRVIGICNRNRTQLNMIKLLCILRDSWVWIPCNAMMSDNDYAAFEKMVMAAKDGEGLDLLVGQTFPSQDETRMVPDILQNGDDFFFPVFTSDTEMSEYGEGFSKMEQHFLYAMILARNNEKNVKGIVINAFSEPFVIDRELFDLIENMKFEYRRNGLALQASEQEEILHRQGCEGESGQGHGGWKHSADYQTAGRI